VALQSRAEKRTTARIDGGEMLVPVLEAQGLRELFTLPGGHLDAIYALSIR